MLARPSVIAGLGPITAAPSLGVKVDTLKSAASGRDVNPSTRATLIASCWLKESLAT